MRKLFILRVSSCSGMTLVEVILALSFLLIISVGFIKLFTFTGITVNQAEHDTNANASARSAVNNLLAAPVDPSTGEPVDISIVWGKGSANKEQDISVIREKIGVDSATGSDGEITLYRKPLPDTAKIEESPLSGIIPTFTIYIEYGDNIYRKETIIYSDEGVTYSEIITPARAEFLISRKGRIPDYWKIAETGAAIANGYADGLDIYTDEYGRIWDINNERIFEESYFIPIWE